MAPDEAVANGEASRMVADPPVRAVAFYLPQFHPIPENDAWWGKGFTEWTNVAKARPLYPGHYQPHVPADLGFYDLRLPEVREAQADLARSYGIEGFCYWHYWFGGGRRILERPFAEVLASGRPDFPFCLGWANQTWTGIWHGAPGRVLIEQTYPGAEDHEQHFRSLLPAFRDRRYMRVEGRLIFVVYAPRDLPDPAGFIAQWNRLAQSEGLPGFFFIAHEYDVPGAGFDAFIANLPFMSLPLGPVAQVKRVINYGLRKTLGTNLKELGIDRRPEVRRYAAFLERFRQTPFKEGELPLLVPNWDNTSRSGIRGVVLQGSTPALFEELCRVAVAKLSTVRDADRRLVFVKAWNEWAEGNHLEPDLRDGTAYLTALQRGLGLAR